MDRNDKNGHRQRLRERYLIGGYQGFHDYEIIEMILMLCFAQKDVKPLAKELIGRYRTVDGVLKADLNELKNIKGIGEKTAVTIKFIGDVVKYSFKNNYVKEDVTTFDGKRDLISYLRNDIGFINNEEFKVIFLNSANQLIRSETLFKGTIDRSAIYPRTIVEKAIYYNARSLIFAHNHPSGNLKPSRKDIEITKELETLLKVVDVKLLDHIIVTKESYLSFLEEGLIDYY